jgi:hypothetical protein
MFDGFRVAGVRSFLVVLSFSGGIGRLAGEVGGGSWERVKEIMGKK